MTQGIAPEVDNIPPAIKWYVRLLRKCSGKVVGNVSQTTASAIKKSDLDFLFWPFIIPFSEIRANFTSKEARDWSSRYDMKIKTWRDNLIEQLRTGLKVREGLLAMVWGTSSITRHYKQVACSL